MEAAVDMDVNRLELNHVHRVLCDVWQVLMEAGADINMKNNLDKTPWRVALENEHQEVGEDAEHAPHSRRSAALNSRCLEA